MTSKEQNEKKLREISDEVVDELIADIAARPELAEGWYSIPERKRQKIRLKWKMFIQQGMNTVRMFA